MSDKPADFPILPDWQNVHPKLARRTTIPWQLMALHEDQALRNHSQSLTELARRGGLSACEAVAVLEDRRWRSMDVDEAFTRLEAIITGFSP